MTTMLPHGQLGEYPAEIQSQLCSFGARLRALRLQRGWTLQELACRGGWSRAFLSRLESGDRNVSIAAALTLARIFEVSLAALFESPLAQEPCVIVRGAEAVVRQTNGLSYAPLSRAGRCFNLQPIKITVPVARPGNEHYHHDGEEWIYVLKGALILSLAGQTYELSPGDAVHFDSRLPHRLIAGGGQEVEVLLVASPVMPAGPALRPAASERRAIAPLHRLPSATPTSPSRPAAARRKSSETGMILDPSPRNPQPKRTSYE